MNLKRFVLLAAVASALGCAGASASQGTPSPAPASMPNPGRDPLMQVTWPVRTREHVDLWLHSYALLMRDTMHVPYFRRDYRDRINVLRRQKGTTLLDANRDKLLARVAVQPSLLAGGQFLPLYFADWAQMRQAINVFVTNGSINSGDQNMRTYLAILGNAFPSPADREWLRTFAASVEDESQRFYHDYWTTETRSRSALVAHVDSLWQRTWRPSLQRLLNNTQQQNGELYLSLPLGGEGRTVQFDKANNAIAVPMPETQAESDIVLYVVAHEITGSIATAAITDNTTPADQRSGVTSRYEQNAAVRAGALLLERTNPTMVGGYMRFYLRQAGMPVPMDPTAAFNSVFGLPENIRAAIAKQLDVILAGI